MITKCDPPREYGTYTRDVRTFAETDWECAEVELYDEPADRVYAALKRAVVRLKMRDVRVVKAEGHVYLMRGEKK